MNCTEFKPTINKPAPNEGNQIAQFGIPGVPFPEPVKVTPVFSQGEDIIYTGKIFVDDELIDVSKWTVTIVLKKSEYAIGVIWTGILNSGLYYVPSTNTFQFWIPASLTANILAGTYWFDVLLQENAGANKGPKPRTIVALTDNFSIAYTMSSQHPDSDSDLPGKAIRNGVELTYPNGYNPLRPSL